MLRQFAKVFFAFDLPEKSPSVLSRAGIPRIEKPNPAFPFWVQQIVKGAKLLCFCLAGVVPEGLARVAEKSIDVTFRANVVLPDMPAPPVFRFSDLGQDHVWLEIVRRSGGHHGKRCRSAGYKHIEVTDTRAMLI